MAASTRALFTAMELVAMSTMNGGRPPGSGPAKHSGLVVRHAWAPPNGATVGARLITLVKASRIRPLAATISPKWPMRPR
ncbi:hypothetical protein D3C87_1593540 [compost metagenome]